MKPADPRAFGRAIADLRRSKGLRRKEVVARLIGLYSEESSYGRVEQGRRTPDRNDALAIIVRGLGITDIKTIDQLLALAGYEGCTREDAERFKLEAPQSPPRVVVQLRAEAIIPRVLQARLAAAVVVILAVLTFLALLRVQEHIGFFLVTSLLYASLYVVSLILESTFIPDHSHLAPAATVLFSFMFATSIAALVTEQAMVEAEYAAALSVSLGILLLAACAQWKVTRPILPGFALAKARFQLLSAQAAHLKNTGYFLLFVVLFWLPPAHAVLVLEREARAGRVQLVRELVSHQVMVGEGLVALNAAPLVGMWVLLVLVSLPMGAHLLDSMRPHPKLNAFYILFYLRAFLYFALSAICLGWYFNALGQFS